MTPTDEIISKLTNKHHSFELFDSTNYKTKINDYLKIIHPDICNHPDANKAVLNLLKLKDEFIIEKNVNDGVSEIKLIDDFTLSIEGPDDLLTHHFDTIKQLKNIEDNSTTHFKKYLPEEIYYTPKKLIIKNKHRMLLANKLILPIEHVAWISNRLLEITSWLHQQGYSHNGINPYSYVIVPETHGILLTTFYHISSLNNKLISIDSRFKHWYDEEVFIHKKSISNIDIKLILHNAIYLLGDKSGSGISLKNIYPEELINFFIQEHNDCFKTYKSFKNLMVKLLGKPKYIHLNI